VEIAADAEQRHATGLEHLVVHVLRLDDERLAFPATARLAEPGAKGAIAVHKVEVTGTLEASTAASSSPTLKVSAVKMVAATCP
jgi:hypothetical protein